MVISQTEPAWLSHWDWAGWPVRSGRYWLNSFKWTTKGSAAFKTHLFCLLLSSSISCWRAEKGQSINEVLRKVIANVATFPLRLIYVQNPVHLERRQNKINGNSIQVALSLGKRSWQTLHETLHGARHYCSSPLIINRIMFSWALRTSHLPHRFTLFFSPYQTQWVWKTHRSCLLLYCIYCVTLYSQRVCGWIPKTCTSYGPFCVACMSPHLWDNWIVLIYAQFSSFSIYLSANYKQSTEHAFR